MKTTTDPLKWAPDIIGADALGEHSRAIWNVIVEARLDGESGLTESAAIAEFEQLAEFDLMLIKQAADELAALLWDGKA